MPRRVTRPAAKIRPDWLDRKPVVRPSAPRPRRLTDRIPVLLFPVRLETRFVGNDLRVRIYPDQLAVETHEPELRGPEVLSGREFRQRFDSAADETERRDAWRALAATYGPGRAAWIAKQIDAYDALGDDLTTLEQAAWTVAPSVRTLPDRFLITVYKDGVVAYEKLGERVPAELPVMRGPTDSADGDDLLYAGARWVEIFEAPEGEEGGAFRDAVSVGMGVTIPLTGAQPPFSHVIAVGLRETLAPARAAALVEDWIDGQHYTGGFAFLSYGTPTNNTNRTKSGHSNSAENAEDRYVTELLGSGGTSLDPERTNGGRLRLALGLAEDSDVFSYVGLAPASSEAYAREAQAVLWAATGDYCVGTMLGEVIPPTHRVRLAEHVERFVRASGPLPALRIGNLPFGVLPVTRVTPASVTNPDGWTASPLDSRFLDGVAAEWSQFDNSLHRVLHSLHGRWLEIATQAEQNNVPAPIPRIGGSGDSDGELLRILAMEPRSTSHMIRRFVDERFVGVLLVFLRHRYAAAGQANDWVRQWVMEWRAFRDRTIALLLELGATDANAALMAPLGRMLGWGEALPIDGPLVGDWVPYLRVLCEQGASAPSDTSPALLFEMLGRAFRLTSNRVRLQEIICDLAGSEVLEFFNRAASPEEIVQRIKDDPSFGPPSPKAYGVRRKLAERLLQTRNSLAGGRFERLEQIDRVLRVGPDTLHDIVAAFPGPKLVDLDGLFRDMLDLCSHRLDAWFTSLATKRLQGMRGEHPTGVHLGAYGWVEGLDRADAAAHRGGFVHAPSLAHAGAAALMRNAFLTHDGGEENPFRIDLTSTRVTRATRVLDGIRQGQPLGALLGYQFERALHEALLDRYIDNFRSAFPLVAGKEIPPTGDEEAAEAVAARNVVDGIALAEARRTGELDIASMVAEQDDLLDANDQGEVQTTLEGAVDDLRDALDAVGDLLLTESVFQAAQGNFDRAGAALDAAAGNARPPEPEAVRTPVSGPGLRHRVCVLLPAEDAADPETVGPRAQAEPTVAAFVASLLGDVSAITFGPDDATATLADAGLEPIDLVYLSAIPPGKNEETDLERLLRYHLRATQGLGSDDVVELRLDRDGGVEQVLEVARRVLTVVTESAVLRPESLARPEEAVTPVFEQGDVNALNARVVAARARLRDNVVDQLDPTVEREDAVILAALLDASRFGIPGALPSAPDETELQVRRERIHAEARARMERCAALRSDAMSGSSSPNQRIEQLQLAMKALFGDGFVVLPTFAVPGDGVMDDALQQNGLLDADADDRIRLWLQQVAETHKAVRRLEDVLMVADAWNPNDEGGSRLSLRVGQLPYCETRPWQALSDDEIEMLAGDSTSATGECAVTPGERPKAVLSIVAVMPEPWNGSSDSVAGLLIDEWTETIPRDEVTTGLSFQYDAPGSQAPHALLLAVPGTVRRGGTWSVESIRAIVKDTLDLAKVRLVDPDALPEVGALFPALFMPVDITRPGWDRPMHMLTLDDTAHALPTIG